MLELQTLSSSRALPCLPGGVAAKYPFMTSDNPVCFKTRENNRWLKAGILHEGNYIVYPLSSDIVLYCKDRCAHWAPLAKFHDCLSPVGFTREMIDHENSGQVFMSSRFVLSPNNDFDAARAFARRVGIPLGGESRLE